ncbi:VOC family protein [Streptomyces sp. HB2AG]|uniref:VOC family protein n=1 Tax=Streptomyces sp. HB2AG TaxID=2983400 RepID=UPI0022AA11F2|nr:VOC family protein [Streptomyces sp. HB2AG]MCZ2525491.1 VOC family protein [Streptomyces sp. HB2AG]
MTEAAASRPQGSPCWVSLLTPDLRATQEFYNALFGWEFRKVELSFGPYAGAVLGEYQVAGIGEIPPGRRNLPVMWTVYLLSEDIDQTAEAVRECGGTVAVGPLHADEAGRMVIASDPAGAVFGVWQPELLQGADTPGTPGTLVWNELVTRETASVEKFYTCAFGVEAEAAGSPGYDYAVLRSAGVPVAGIRGIGTPMPRGRGPRWVPHFAVEDADATARRAVELGGDVVREPHDTPHGRQAELTDRAGAAFVVVAAGR